MNNYYYLDANRQQQGPVPGESLLQYGVNASTYVFCQGMTQWTLAGQVPELASLFCSVPPIPPVGGVNAGQPKPPCPDNHMVWAILSTLFCCLPFGIVSIVYASKVEGLWLAGQYEAANHASKNASNWAMYSAISALVVGVIYFFVFFAAAGAAL